MRRSWAIAMAAGLAICSRAQQDLYPLELQPVERAPKEERVLLIPIDDRPVSWQFAQMIGEIAGVTVETPPLSTLGRFTRPGDPEGILEWLRANDLSKYSAVLFSTDMIAYGGLIASRTDATSYQTAIQRLRAFQRLLKDKKKLRVVAFSSIMRLAPTATRAAKPWRSLLVRYAEAKERYRLSSSPKAFALLQALRSKLPGAEIARYDSIRLRDHRVQQELIRLSAQGVFSQLMLGQDDAQPVGPHVPETTRLRQMAQNLKVGSRVSFCEGVDQLPNMALSRALLAESGWTPKVRVVYSDDTGRSRIAAYETNPLEKNLINQLLAAGATPTKGPSYDYELFVNVPKPTAEPFAAWLQSLKADIDEGRHVAIADVNLGFSGTADPKLFDFLSSDARATKLLAYAGWNTAGNTLGTTVPAANVALLARRMDADPLRREIARRAFLLHRMVSDYEYYRFTRPQVYAMIDRDPKASREETYGRPLRQLNAFVQGDLEKRLRDTFRDQLQGQRFYAGTRQYEVRGLSSIDIGLPWPRAYEVRLGFQLDVGEIQGR